MSYKTGISDLPLLYAKKEVFNWLKQGIKTIDVRKGYPLRGEIIVFQSGRHTLKFKIVKKESGFIDEILRLDNFRQVIPSAAGLCEAADYLKKIYGVCEGVFTAYYVEPLDESEKR